MAEHRHPDKEHDDMQNFNRILGRCALALVAGTLATGAVQAQNNEWQNNWELERARQAQRAELQRRSDAEHGWHYRHDHDTHRRAEEWRRRHGDPDYRPSARWERGEHWRGRAQRVDNPQRYQLRPAPRGTHWVRADDHHYLLVGNESRRILEVVRR